jgi:hypothetical protein
MALSENGIFTDNILPNPVLIPKQGQDSRYDLNVPENGLFLSVPVKAQATSTVVWSEPEVSRTRVVEGAEETGFSRTKVAETPKETLQQAGNGKEGGEELLFNGLSPKDVVVLVKTGATSLWRRMPGHSKYLLSSFPSLLFNIMYFSSQPKIQTPPIPKKRKKTSPNNPPVSTTLSNSLLTPNIILYSDTPDSINGHPIIDVLANTSSLLKSSPDFELYTKAAQINAQNLYLESGSMEGDTYLPGGWRLDKYKFVPMFAHVAKTMPGKKWYVYMEDDNYFFWENLYSWLGTLDHTSPLLIGSPAFRLGEDFAHGGSGFAVSRKALEVSFGAEEGLADRFEEYAREQCCGDQVLSHVFKEKGVERYKELDGGGWAALQSLPVWRIGFGGWNWCSPIMNVHKVHQADVSRLFEFEKEFKTKNGKGKGMRYRDLFAGFAKGNIDSEEKSEWDNYASAKTFSSSGDEDVSGGKGSLGQKVLEKKPWFSKEACKKACVEWEQCLSWKYADDNCGLDHTAAMGQKIDAGIRMESGWMLERIRKLEKMSCEPLSF